MAQLFENAARSALQASILAADTSMTVDISLADLFPVANTGASAVGTGGLDYFKSVLQDTSGNIEIVYVRTRALGAATFTNVIRGQEGTTARNYAAGSIVGLRLTAADHESALADIGVKIAAATSKATPVDADTLALSDSAASGVLKKLTWANVKATLKTYFDTLYATVSGLAATNTAVAGKAALGANSDITSLTALTAGGLPDNSVLTADIANAQITAPKLSGAQTGSAPIYGVRAWVNFNGTGTVAINGSGNVSSITDNGTGDYTINFTTAMSDANYSFALGCCPEGAGTAGGRIAVAEFGGVAASSLRIYTSTGGGKIDLPVITAQIIR